MCPLVSAALHGTVGKRRRLGAPCVLKSWAPPFWGEAGVSSGQGGPAGMQGAAVTVLRVSQEGRGRLGSPGSSLAPGSLM